MFHKHFKSQYLLLPDEKKKKEEKNPQQQSRISSTLMFGCGESCLLKEKAKTLAILLQRAQAACEARFFGKNDETATLLHSPQSRAPTAAALA